METTRQAIDIDSLLDTFGLNTTFSNVILEEWLNVEGKLNSDDQRLMKILYERISKFGDYWNEEELKINFIGILFLLADIDEDGKIKTFFERSVAATVDGIPLAVKSDCMIATPKGKGTPKAPYFFLQEYKKQKGDKNDPEGQMLAAMLIAQALNNDQKPIYGTWLVGSIWWFSTLVGKEYTKSRKYDASQEKDLLQIILILRKLKRLILNRNQ
jgi:hypothetical protein